MSVLICDSNSEVWYSRLEELGMDYISMPYLIEDKEYYYDLGKNTDFSYFYNAIKNGAIPKTMALNPEDYKAFLTPYFERGEDVLYISFSHAMSGTFNQLHTALNELKEIYPDRKCTVFNTNSISLGAGIQVEEAGRLKKEGKTDEEILAHLRDFTNRSAMYFVVDDLMHLKRGGRLTAAAAFAGTVLGIKPILTVDKNGALAVYEKQMGKKKALRSLADKVILGAKDGHTVYIIQADCIEDAELVEKLILEKRPNLTICKQIVGPVVGCHCGQGTVGVIFVADERPIPLEGNE